MARKGITILNKHIEEEKAALSKPSEVITYKLTPEELAKYGPIENNTEIPMILDTSYWGHKKKFRDDKGESQVKINKELIKEELAKGLNKEQIAEKYNANIKAVGMLVGKVQKELESESKPIIHIDEIDKFDKKQLLEKGIVPGTSRPTKSNLKMEVTSLDITGKVFKYRYKDNHISIIRENQGFRIGKDEFDRFIDEITELKNIISEN